jgi:hypothetical protein
MANQYTVGLDYGTNSVRALVVDTDNGHEVGRRLDLFARRCRAVRALACVSLKYTMCQAGFLVYSGQRLCSKN